MKPLTEFPKNTKVTVKSIGGGRRFQHRLKSMGIVIGKTLEINKNGPGPLLIKVDNTRLMLGQGEAKKIFAEKLNNKSLKNK